jgi:hypothetical protein
MAVRIDASGEKLYRTANLPNRSNFTISGWAYRHASVGSTYQYFVGMEDATTNASAWALAGWLDTGVWHVSTSSGYQTGTGPSNTTWFYWYLKCDNSTSPDTYTLGWKTAGGSWTNVSVTYDLTFTPAWLVFGNDSYDEWSNISFERVRVWDAALTTTELDAEMVSPAAVRTSNLRSSSNLTVHTDLTDSSGNGYTLTAGGTLSTTTPGPALTISPAAIASAATVYVPTISAAGGGAQTISPIAIASTAAVYAPTVTPGTVALTPNAIASTAVVYAPSVGVGVSTVHPNAIASGATVYAPTITPGAATISPAAISSAATVYAPDVLARATIAGVLTVDGTNGRYFRNTAGIVLLAGFHTWYEFYDGSASYPPTGIDYNTWLDYLDTRGVNYHKLWMPETARQWADVDHYFDPLPYQRTGPGNAADGRPKFDLTQFNQEYFDRLRQRALLAGNRGHYVVVKFFEGWQIDIHGYYYYPFDYHWFNSANNINSINGDPDADRNGEETRDLAQTAIVAYQQAYIHKTIDTLNDLDNVLWEISNEDVSTSQAWQYHWIDDIHTYEAGKAKQHPVGMSSTFHAANDTELYASNAEWIAGSAAFPANMTAVDGTKVYLYDTDHVMGLTNNHVWVWRAFTRGYNPIYMDEYDGALYGTDRRSDATYERIRYNLGAVLDYAARLDLQHMTPQNSLSDTGYALAKTTGAVQIVAYQDYSGAFTVNLTGISGTFALEWLRTNATTPTVQSGGTVSGGASRVLTPPWAGEDVIVFLEKFADEIAPAYISSTATVYTPTVTPGAVTLAPNAIGSSAVVYAPTVAAGAVTIAPGAIASTAAVYAPTIVIGAVTIYPNAIVSTATVYVPTLTPGAVTITPNAIASAAVVYAPAITSGAILYPDAIASTATVYAPTITPGAATIAPDVVVSAAVVYAPTVAAGAVVVAPDAISSTAAVYAPTVAGSAPTIYPDAITSAATVYAPTLTPGAVTIAPDAIASVSVVFSPFVGNGMTQLIAPDYIASTAQVFAATLAGIVASRIYRVAAEDRTFAVEYENRTYTVQGA